MPEKATLAQLEMAQAVVYDYLKPTPEICWPLLSQRCGCEVWVKHENHTSIGAFKVRGGLNYLNDLCKNNTPVSGIISATRGNHGQSLAFACAQKGIPLTIIVPIGNNPEKNQSMKALGAELLVFGQDFQEARERAEVIAADKGLHLIGAFHPLLMRGVGTYAMEFFSQVSDLDKVYVPIGQGSGICGTISARDALGLTTKIVGVVAENAACYALSFEQKTSVSTETADTIADGLACRIPDQAALEIILQGADNVVTVSDQEIRCAMKYYYTDTHNVAEGAAAAPLAALLKEREQLSGKAGKKVGLVHSGGNADTKLLISVLED